VARERRRPISALLCLTPALILDVELPEIIQRSVIR
jgi:hypothetical protein